MGQTKYKKTKKGSAGAVDQVKCSAWHKAFPFVAGALALAIIALTVAIILLKNGAFDEKPKKEDLSVYAPTVESEGHSEGSYNYSVLSDGTAMIVGLTENAEDTEVYIPSEIGGRKVTAIGDKSFFMDTAITRVVIPEGVTYVGYQAFWGCVNLETLSLPSTLCVIRESAFEMCEYLDGVSFSGTRDAWIAVKVGENNPIGYVYTVE